MVTGFGFEMMEALWNEMEVVGRQHWNVLSASEVFTFRWLMLGEFQLNTCL